MPIVLNQRAWTSDPRYLDREWVIYHYPRQYRTRIRAYDRFVYYRPATGALSEERSTYFGHGVLGVPFDDPHRADHSFVPIAWSEPFRTPVSLRDAEGVFYETEAETQPQFQNSARNIAETAFFRILALGGISARAAFTRAMTTETVVSLGFARRDSIAPKDVLRRIDRIPEGTGYVPSGAPAPDLFESAALQERARADHQDVLELVRRQTMKRGGSCYFNNNIDLFVKLGERRYLIEAKSLVDPTSAVDRMRYGMGQLFDYGVRYRAELENAEPVLAFGTRPPQGVAWIGSVLEGNAVAFVAREGTELVPLNARGEQLTFLTR